MVSRAPVSWNEWTNRPWCQKCNRLGCYGGFRHFTFNFSIWFKKKKIQLHKKLFDFDYTKIDDVEIDGIDTRDYPDFCDAFIVSATYKGKEMTDKQIEKLNENSDFVYEQVMNRIF